MASLRRAQRLCDKHSPVIMVQDFNLCIRSNQFRYIRCWKYKTSSRAPRVSSPQIFCNNPAPQPLQEPSVPAVRPFRSPQCPPFRSPQPQSCYAVRSGALLTPHLLTHSSPPAMAQPLIDAVFQTAEKDPPQADASAPPPKKKRRRSQRT